MEFQIKAFLSYAVVESCDILVQIEVAEDAEQMLSDTTLKFSTDLKPVHRSGSDGIGTRFWVFARDEFQCTYETTVSIKRPGNGWKELPPSAFSKLPDEAIKYLMPSRFCHPEQFQEFTSKQFAGLAGGEAVDAMSQWIGSHLEYVAGASNAQTTAFDTFKSRKGVCRDYAHVLITMSRAIGIPARMVSAYGPGVKPEDFHAVVQVFLHGGWHLVDPTGMVKTEDTIVIGVGRDAADISFLTAYGSIELKEQSVSVRQISSH